MVNQKAFGSEITLLNMLQVLFIAYKLAGIIDWSWWWVLSPYLIVTGMVFVGALVAGGIKSAKADS